MVSVALPPADCVGWSRASLGMNCSYIAPRRVVATMTGVNVMPLVIFVTVTS